ncbi:MAG: response regulator transcription factor [Candidatus Aminicenantes bacterium]|nr:response regulator transcription factor [Candidatus Aminicenantes bacterium]
MKKKILIIEDEQDLVKGLRLNLIDEGYEVIWAEDGLMGFLKAQEELPDLIILDIMLPKMDGLEVCRELRKKNINIPIIMLTAKGEEVDKVVGLEIGADDYMTKPFSIRELLARIKAHLRRETREDKNVPDVYRLEDLEIDFTFFKVRRKGKESDLTSLEAEILKYFIAHKGEVVKRDVLLDKIWGYEKYPTTRTIDNHILKLRKKVEEDPARPKYILSVYGEGYRFLGR